MRDMKAFTIFERNELGSNHQNRILCQEFNSRVYWFCANFAFS